tara:strand:+ start:255 stop:1016 length:762 start_codon:yes stop_codon:yes gene_type:complete
MGILQNENAIPVASAGGLYDYQISQSARLDRSSSSYLNRTLSTPTNIDKGTFSFWFKRGLISTDMQLVHTSDGGGINWIFNANDTMTMSVASGSDAGSSDAVFRDTGGFNHFVMAVDTTQGSNNDRVKGYLNGTQLSGFTGTITQNTDYKFNKSGNVLYIGHNTGASINIDGYMAELIFIDGQQLAPTSFGESKNGVWIPKDPSSLTFGNNGFWLKFQDSSALGDDSSGNTNDFSTNGVDVDHQVLDSPTFGS